MIERMIPPPIFEGLPCSQVAVGTALRHYVAPPSGLKADGYLSLDAMRRYIQAWLTVVKVESFRRGERPTLTEFLERRNGFYIICVEGHFIFAEGQEYWSFFDNDYDLVVRAWQIRG